MRNISSLLAKALEKDGVLAGFIVDSDGLLIEGSAQDGVDLEAAGALVSKCVDHNENLTRELEGGALRWTILCSDDRSYLIYGLDCSALLVLVGRGSPWAEGLPQTLQAWLPAPDPWPAPRLEDPGLEGAAE
jgi:predicted regulator of Ras-like GTPase activity (Roadblock/LC7/MglB family)